MIVQGVNKKRCMDIDQESGEVHYVARETKEQQERTAISKLSLWKNVGYKKPPFFIAEDSTVSLYKIDSEKGRADDMVSIRQKSIENAHRGYIECSQLLALNDLINQEYFTLQTCSRPFIQPKGTHICIHLYIFVYIYLNT